ncbi:MAG TPA: hypothetical protein VL989_02340 [Candidatus Sulfotelmatobacter sp.]|nr:hypothetical protein [Candidatus Sulfotelmatobacter sp.]
MFKRSLAKEECPVKTLLERRQNNGYTPTQNDRILAHILEKNGVTSQELCQGCPGPEVVGRVFLRLVCASPVVEGAQVLVDKEVEELLFRPTGTEAAMLEAHPLKSSSAQPS